MEEELRQASDRRDLERARRLLGQGVPQSPNYSGNSPLCLAAYKGHVEIVRLLLESGAIHSRTSKDRLLSF